MQLTGTPVTSGVVVVVSGSSGVYVQKIDTVAVLVSDVDLPGVPEEFNQMVNLETISLLNYFQIYWTMEARCKNIPADTDTVVW